MRHHTEDGDNVKAADLIMLCQIVKVEVYVPEVIQVVSKLLILAEKEPRRMCI